MEENKGVSLPEAKNPLTRDEADKMIALIRLDIARFSNEKANSLAIAANADCMIAQSEVAIADIERRVANVDYPAEQANAPTGDAAENSEPAKAE